MAQQNEQQKQWAKIVAKAWADEKFKKRLLDDPAAVLNSEGVVVPEGVAIKALEATEKQAWLVLPPKPSGAISEGEERLAAGAFSECMCI